MSEPKVAREVAETEFLRWVVAMGLGPKLDPSALTQEDKRVLADHKNLILHAIMDGRLVVNGDDLFVYTPAKGNQEPITFFEPTGAMLMASDKIAEGQQVAKQFRVMSEITKTNIQRFADMLHRDLEVCHAISQIFLART
jgi:hypothetical protein